VRGTNISPPSMGRTFENSKTKTIQLMLSAGIY
jgi:hypothetical protein